MNASLGQRLAALAVTALALIAAPASHAQKAALVTDLDHPSKQAFQKQVALPSLNSPVAVFVVPAGKRLVIEFYTAEAFVALGQTFNRFFLGVQDPALPPGNLKFNHLISPTFHGPSFGQEVYLATHMVRLYVEPGEEVVVSATGDGTGSALVSVGGYLVDIH